CACREYGVPGRWVHRPCFSCAAGNRERANKRVRAIDGGWPDRSRWPARIRLQALCLAYLSRLLEDDRVRNQNGYLRESVGDFVHPPLFSVTLARCATICLASR